MSFVLWSQAAYDKKAWHLRGGVDFLTTVWSSYSPGEGFFTGGRKNGHREDREQRPRDGVIRTGAAPSRMTGLKIFRCRMCRTCFSLSTGRL